MLGNNMFAYCRNNPVSRIDASGTEDVGVEEKNENGNIFDDIGNPTGGSGHGTGISPGGNVKAGKITIQSSSNSATVKNYLESLGQDSSAVTECFSGDPQLQVLTEDTTVFRVWGGTTPEYGHWVSPYDYGEAARGMLSLPPGNTMTNTSSFVIPTGTIVLTGVASPKFEQLGGGIQWWIYHIECQSQM